MGSILSAVFGLTIVLFATTGSAQPAEDAESLIHQGIELRRHGDDLRAEGYFKRAYEIAHTPRATAQLGLVELALKDYRAAEVYLTNALEGSDAWVRSYRKTLEESRAAAREHLGRVEVTDAPPGASAAVEGEPRVTLPTDGVLWLAPGTNVVAFEAPGRQPSKVTIRCAEKATQRISIGPILTPLAPSSAVRVEKAPPPSPEAPSAVGSTRTKTVLRWVGLGLGVTGVAAGAIGAAFLLDGNSKRDAIETAANNGTQRYNPSDGNWKMLQDRGTALMIGGAIGLVGGTTLVVLSSRSKEVSAAVPVAFSIIPELGGVQLAGRF